MEYTLFSQHTKMFNLDDFTKEHSKEHNLKSHIFHIIRREC